MFVFSHLGEEFMLQATPLRTNLPCRCTQLVFYKGAKSHSKEEGQSSQQILMEELDIQRQTNESQLKPHILHKNQFKMNPGHKYKT